MTVCRLGVGVLSACVAGSVALLAAISVASAALGRRLPTSFVPDEDYGYFTINVQLPPAASPALIIQIVSTDMSHHGLRYAPFEMMM